MQRPLLSFWGVNSNSQSRVFYRLCCSLVWKERTNYCCVSVDYCTSSVGRLCLDDLQGRVRLMASEESTCSIAVGCVEADHHDSYIFYLEQSPWRDSSISWLGEEWLPGYCELNGKGTVSMYGWVIFQLQIYMFILSIWSLDLDLSWDCLKPLPIPAPQVVKCPSAGQLFGCGPAPYDTSWSPCQPPAPFSGGFILSISWVCGFSCPVSS